MVNLPDWLIHFNGISSCLNFYLKKFKKKRDSAVRAPVVNKVGSRKNKEALRDVREKWKNFLQKE